MTLMFCPFCGGSSSLSVLSCVAPLEFCLLWLKLQSKTFSVASRIQEAWEVRGGVELSLTNVALTLQHSYVAFCNYTFTASSQN